MDSSGNDLVAQRLAKAARESLGSYCAVECMAHCCRDGFILLSEKEVALMPGVRKEGLKRVKTKDRGVMFAFDLSARGAGCPNLHEFKCRIHKDPSRPKACGDFPVFLLADKTVLVTYACHGVQENKLYPFMAEFKRKGYKIIYSQA